MRICVIPDLHNRVHVADEIIAQENDNVDEFLFLGDYFDDYEDTPENVRNTGLFINEYINNDRFKFLIGNHDVQYIIDHPAFACKGSWEREKHDAINEVVTVDAWEKMLWTHIDNKWLFSHAGIVWEGPFDQEKHDGNLNFEIQNVIEGDLPFSRILGYGGEYWDKDFFNRSVYAEGDGFIYNQMFGHTVLFDWKCTQYVGYRAYNIDTHNQHYAVVNTDNDYVEIKRTNYTHRYYRKEIQCLLKTKQLSL